MYHAPLYDTFSGTGTFQLGITSFSCDFEIDIVFSDDDHSEMTVTVTDFRILGSFICNVFGIGEEYLIGSVGHDSLPDSIASNQDIEFDIGTLHLVSVWGDCSGDLNMVFNDNAGLSSPQIAVNGVQGGSCTINPVMTSIGGLPYSIWHP